MVKQLILSNLLDSTMQTYNGVEKLFGYKILTFVCKRLFSFVNFFITVFQLFNKLILWQSFIIFITPNRNKETSIHN
jgi:hypothetical protein